MGFPEIGKQLSKMGSFPPKFIIKMGMTATVLIRRGQLSEDRAADPRPSASHVTPPGGTKKGLQDHAKRSMEIQSNLAAKVSDTM